MRVHHNIEIKLEKEKRELERGFMPDIFGELYYEKKVGRRRERRKDEGGEGWERLGVFFMREHFTDFR